jgi:hypothetical protein
MEWFNWSFKIQPDDVWQYTVPTFLITFLAILALFAWLMRRSGRGRRNWGRLMSEDHRINCIIGEGVADLLDKMLREGIITRKQQRKKARDLCIALGIGCFRQRKHPIKLKQELKNALTKDFQARAERAAICAPKRGNGHLQGNLSNPDPYIPGPNPGERVKVTAKVTQFKKYC